MLLRSAMDAPIAEWVIGVILRAGLHLDVEDAAMRKRCADAWPLATTTASYLLCSCGAFRTGCRD